MTSETLKKTTSTSQVGKHQCREEETRARSDQPTAWLSACMLVRGSE